MAGVPLAVTVVAATALAYGTGFGAFGEGTADRAAAAPAASWADDTADGFASMDARGQNGTYSATVALLADDTQMRHLTVANDFDEKAHQDLEGQQAVALRTGGDRVFLDGLVVTGDQDTLMLDAASASGSAKARSRVYVRNSHVTGNVDFVFGRATAVLDRSVLTLKKRWDGGSTGYVTAPGTPAGRPGFLITRSRIAGDVADGGFHLGRPWHAGGDASLDPQTTVRDTALGGAVKSAPWTDMGGFSWKDDRFAEYGNTGEGAGPASEDRPHLTDEQAAAQDTAHWLGDWTPKAE
ncbi:hypothetical protein GCM10009801_67590 [Streptomyces albiaxialis]|uniref:Pectinesterase catalytic domain-containing protein n=1 Tax=Streptomyces albiaxialis TaxID=329523 RepID=A0ABN2WQW4_9ACTN